jgi:hypothetical protein
MYEKAKETRDYASSPSGYEGYVHVVGTVHTFLHDLLRLITLLAKNIQP